MTKSVSHLISTLDQHQHSGLRHRPLSWYLSGNMESDTDFSLYIPKSIWGKKKKNIEEQRNVIPILNINTIVQWHSYNYGDRSSSDEEWKYNCKYSSLIIRQTWGKNIFKCKENILLPRHYFLISFLMPCYSWNW